MKYILLIILFYTALLANYSELLFNGNCITCHNKDNLNKSAPTIIEIQERYKKAFPDREDFIKYMSQWVYKPNEENSIMLDAIKEYKLMPELAFDMETLKEISEFIYDKDFK